LDKREGVLTLDEKLLQFDEGNPYVEIQTGEQVFEKKPLKLGLSDGIYVEVLEGISSEDKIKVWNQTGF
jgi:HlyD family secretion protein